MKHNYPYYPLKRQKIDERDYSHKALIDVQPKVKLPCSVDLRNKCPPVYNQLKLGSCTANAGCAAREMLDNDNLMFSRLFQYYNERLIEGTVDKDAGAVMRDIGKAMYNYGVCLEASDPYNIINYALKPSPQAYNEATAYKIKGYYSISDINGIKQVLALKSQPVMIGIEVYESFESAKVAKTGKVPLPKKNEAMLGGHAVLVVGYNDYLFKKYFICRNSWGSNWGDKGYFYLPYSYFTKYTYDYWVLD